MVLALCNIDKTNGAKAEIVKQMIVERPQALCHKNEMKTITLLSHPALEGDVGLQEFVEPRS